MPPVFGKEMRVPQRAAASCIAGSSRLSAYCWRRLFSRRRLFFVGDRRSDCSHSLHYSSEEENVKENRVLVCVLVGLLIGSLVGCTAQTPTATPTLLAPR